MNLIYLNYETVKVRLCVPVPVALKGVHYKPMPASRLLRDNLFIYGIGGIISPFIGIKLIDMILVALHLAR